MLATLIQHEEGVSGVAFPYWQLSDFSHQPTSAVLRNALERILTNAEISCKYCFFIDGLDEYQETDNGLRGELAESILGLARLSAVKLVVSNRPEPAFKLRFTHCPSMELHDFTRRDIAAYVDAEIRRRALPQVLSSAETDELNSLCDEVIWKAEGVFLWVIIAVASILNGIADYETLPDLKFRLGQLDPRLTVLFKQVLTERIQACHRKKVARSLLTEARLTWSRNRFYLWTHWYINVIIQAISPQVDTSHDNGLLLEQAGDDFRVDEAIAVGRLANLAYQLERTQPLDERGIKELIIVTLHSVEMAERSTGLIQTELISIFDEVLGRDFRSCGLALGDILGKEWDPFPPEGTESNSAYLEPQGFCDHRSYLLTAALAFGFSCYLKHMITTSCGIPFKNGTPLLFYPL